MRHLGWIIYRGPRRIALLGGIVLLPAVALGLLAFRAFQGERVRAEYQRRERQQQILRLLESELSSWILSRCGEADCDTFAFEVRQNRVLLPRLNVYLSPDHLRAPEPRLSSRDSNLWRDAQAIEFQGDKPATVIQNYRRLLSGDPAVSSWSKLALLRIALRRAASSDAGVWLKEIQDTDQAAMTESGIPIRVAAALLLIEHDGAALPAERAGFLRRTLSQLASAEPAREAEIRLAALTAAEDFEGRIDISGDNTQPAAASLPTFPFLEASFPERDQTLWRSHLRSYSIFYATALLLLGAGAGLLFTYRAVAREMEVSRMKAEFVSSVSHEFRTPLSAIEALLERLESGKVRDEEMLRRYYQASRREVQRLTAMVNQLLDFSRLKEGREEFSFQTTDLNLLAEEAVQSFRNLGFGARLVDALDRERPLNVSVERDAAYQCIHNLIDNALKYSPDGTQVTIVSGRRDGEVFLRVSDRGPGVAPAERELIFEQFYRAKSAGVQGIQGAGIGLALVKRVMQAHGGTVTLEGSTGEGSTFQLTFPEVRS